MVDQPADNARNDDAPQDPRQPEPFDQPIDPDLEFKLKDADEPTEPEPTQVPLFDDDEDELAMADPLDGPSLPEAPTPPIFDDEEDDHVEPIRLADIKELPRGTPVDESTAPPPPQAPPRRLTRTGRSGLDNIAYILLVFAALVAPVQYAVKIGPAQATAFDALIGLAMIFFVLDIVARQAWREVRWPRAALWTMVALAALSGLFVYKQHDASQADRASAEVTTTQAIENTDATTTDTTLATPKAEVGPVKLAAKELAQWIEIFIVAFMVAVNLTWSRKRLMGLLAAAGVGVTAVVGYAGWQYLQPDIDPLNVSATLDHRHAYGAVLAMALPAFWAAVLFAPRWWVKAWGMVVAIVGLATMLAGGPLLAAIVGILLVSALKSRTWVLVTTVALAAAVIAPEVAAIRRQVPLYPRHNVSLAAESLAFHVPNPNSPSELIASPRYIEWQAVTNSFWFTDRPPVANINDRQNLAQRMLLGSGVGNYQQRLSPYRQRLPKIARNDTENGTQNVFLVVAFSVGLPALFALVWLLAGAFGDALRRGFALHDAGLVMVQFVACSAVAGFAVSGLFADMLARGIPFYLVLAVAASRSAALLRSK